MTLFWGLSALLAAAVLALLLRPQLRRRRDAEVSRRELNLSVYRDQRRELDADLAAGTLARADYERSRLELEKRLLEDVEGPAPRVAPATRPRFVMGLAALIPVLALAVYAAVGTPGAMDPRLQVAQTIGEAEIEAMVARLAERMQQNPEDPEGWKMLGRSYQVLGRFAEAAKAYGQAAARAPRDPQILTDLADALAMAQGQSMQGQPEELVLRALQLDPKNPKALALAGSAAYERQDYAAAAALWERMLPLVAPDSEDARAVRANIEEARARAANKAAPARALQGIVQLAPALADKVAPQDTLFIFARAAQGPPMPLAVLRRKAGDLPFAFRLDDSLAMSPALKLSAQPRVVVGARISKSGNATPQPGDLQGLSAAVDNTAQGVVVTIDSVRGK